MSSSREWGREQGAQLKRARERAGLTQAELARAIKAGRSSVPAWEQGSYGPSEANLTAAARVLNTTPAALRYGHENGHANLMVRETAGDRVPPIALGLPKSVRVWLHGFLLELAEADVPDEQIESARAALTSPENFTFFVGGQPTDYTEEEILDGLKAFALHIRGVLRERGFKVRAK